MIYIQTPNNFFQNVNHDNEKENLFLPMNFMMLV